MQACTVLFQDCTSRQHLSHPEQGPIQVQQLAVSTCIRMEMADILGSILKQY